MDRIPGRTSVKQQRSYTTKQLCITGNFRTVREWKSLSHVRLLWPHGLYSLWNSPGQNTGVGSLSLLQGIFPIQGSNPDLPHCRWILYQLSHQGGPRILEWVAYPFSSGSSQPRNRTGVSCIAGGFFTSWDTWEVSDLGKGKFWASPVAQW